MSDIEAKTSKKDETNSNTKISNSSASPNQARSRVMTGEGISLTQMREKAIEKRYSTGTNFNYQLGQVDQNPKITISNNDDSSRLSLSGSEKSPNSPILSKLPTSPVKPTAQPQKEEVKETEESQNGSLPHLTASRPKPNRKSMYNTVKNPIRDLQKIPNNPPSDSEQEEEEEEEEEKPEIKKVESRANAPIKIPLIPLNVVELGSLRGQLKSVKKNENDEKPLESAKAEIVEMPFEQLKSYKDEEIEKKIEEKDIKQISEEKKKDEPKQEYQKPILKHTEIKQEELEEKKKDEPKQEYQKPTLKQTEMKQEDREVKKKDEPKQEFQKPVLRQTDLKQEDPEEKKKEELKQEFQKPILKQSDRKQEEQEVKKSDNAPEFLNIRNQLKSISKPQPKEQQVVTPKQEAPKSATPVTVQSLPVGRKSSDLEQKEKLGSEIDIQRNKIKSPELKKEDQQKTLANAASADIVKTSPIRTSSASSSPYKSNLSSKTPSPTKSFGSSVKSPSSTDVPEFSLIKQKLKTVSSGLGNSKSDLASNTNLNEQQSDLPEFARLRSKLKSVQSGMKESSSKLDLSTSASTQNMKELAKDSGSNSTSKQTSNENLEFVSLRQKLKTISNQQSMSGSMNTVRDEPQPQKPSSNYSRYASVGPKVASDANRLTPTSANVVSGNVDRIPVTLKNIKQDSFIASFGGATRIREPIFVVVRGKKKVTAKKIPLDVGLLNQTDPFILDLNPNPPEVKDDPEKPLMRNIYVLTGPSASKIKRTRAIEIANLIKDFDYSGKAEIFLVDLQVDSNHAFSDAEMIGWQCLFGKQVSKEQVAEFLKEKVPKKDAVDGVDFEADFDQQMKFYEFRKDEKVLAADNGGQLKYELLKTDACFVLNTKSEVYCWAGKASDEQSRQKALQFAQKTSEEEKATLFMEGESFERTIFKLKFPDWPQGHEMDSYIMQVKQQQNIKAKDKEWKVYDRGSDQQKIDRVDILKMYDREASLAQVVKNTEAQDIEPSELMKRDWGFGRLRVWRVYDIASGTDKKTVVVDEQLLQKMERKFDQQHPLILYSQECYIFLYEYKERPPKMSDQVLAERLKVTKEDLLNSMKDNAVLYCWSGSESKITDQGFMAHFVLELEKMIKEGKVEVRAKAKHLRVQEGRESVHFLNMLRGGNLPRDQPQRILSLLPMAEVKPTPVVVYRQGNEKSFGSDSVAMYHVLGTGLDHVRAGQLPNASSQFLSSAHCFVVSTKDSIYQWQGSGSFEFEREGATLLSNLLLTESKRKVITVEEGKEPAEFFSLLGGKSQYDHLTEYSKRPQLNEKQYQVRLWHINHFINNNPTATEIPVFTCHDLKEDSVYILDTYFSLYVWIGSHLARSQLKAAQSGFRDMKLALETAERYAQLVLEKDQRLQNRVFVVQSGKESPEFKSQFLYWQERNAKDDWPSQIPLDEALSFLNRKKYSVKELIQFAIERKNLPFGVDLEHLELYLSPEDFEKCFGMQMEPFFKMPQWKQLDLKKKQELF